MDQNNSREEISRDASVDIISTAVSIPTAVFMAVRADELYRLGWNYEGPAVVVCALFAGGLALNAAYSWRKINKTIDYLRQENQHKNN